MREHLLTFLEALAERIPAPFGCHHALMRIEGNLLSLQLNVHGKFHCFIIEPGDLEKDIPQLVSEIEAGLKAMSA